MWSIMGNRQRRRQTLASRGQKSFRGHMASVEPETPNASKGLGMGRGYPPPQPTRGLGDRRKLPGEKRFYCFLSTSERLSLQCLLKINVVHSLSLVEKKIGLLNGEGQKIEATEATAWVMFCSSCVGK